MEYTATEIVEATGVPLRTIRLWSERRLLPPPLGRGPGTRYTEHHRILVRAIAKLRMETHQLKAIKKTIAKLSREELLRLIGEEPEEAEKEEEEVAKRAAPAPPLPPQATTGDNGRGRARGSRRGRAWAMRRCRRGRDG